VRWQDIQTRFTKLGFGKPVVSLVREGTGAYLQVKGEGGKGGDVEGGLSPAGWWRRVILQNASWGYHLPTSSRGEVMGLGFGGGGVLSVREGTGAYLQVKGEGVYFCFGGGGG
jgi:hypothetical protein